jgi:hypothetical protein
MPSKRKTPQAEDLGNDRSNDKMGFLNSKSIFHGQPHHGHETTLWYPLDAACVQPLSKM